MAMTPGVAPSRIFYGWRVALAIIVLLSSGIRFTIALVMAASLVLTGRMTTLWEFYLYYAVIGSLGLAATGHVMGSVMLARWFVHRRGVTMSLLGSASMVGMAVLATWCILRYGWRTSLVILGAASLVVTLPLVLWVLRGDPESVGLEPDGMPVPSASPAPSLLERAAVADALRVPSFRLLTAGLFNCGFSMSLLSRTAYRC